ncbi:CHAT domain-containing protein [Streptomyces sp. NPDC014684]|uniref:CHAT domain-containing protein n=1 Tax=Streptomyces sp. NPDC014684 TaxID=3364880 RepID=UPI0036FBB03F
MRLNELFPSAVIHLGTEEAQRELNLSEPLEVLWAVMQVQPLQQRAQTPFHLRSLTRGLLEDIDRLSVDAAAPQHAVHVLRASVCCIPASVAFRHGDRSGMWDWVHSAFSDEVPRGDGMMTTDPSVLLRVAGHPTWHRAALPAVATLATPIYYLAWAHAAATDLAEAFYPRIVSLCAEGLPVGAPVAEIAINLIPWQRQQERDAEAAQVSRALETWLYSHPTHHAAGRAAGLLTGLDRSLLSRSPLEIGAWTLRNVPLTDPEAFDITLRMGICSGRGWAASHFDQLRSGLSGLLAGLPAEDALGRSHARGQIFRSCEPVLYDLLQAGEFQLLSQWIATWQGVSLPDARTNRVIIVAAAAEGAWFRPGTAVRHGSSAVLSEFVESANEALGLAYTAPGLPDAALTTPATGAKSEEHTAAVRFQEAVYAFVDAANLADFVRSEQAEGLISLLPPFTPLQALLARAGGPVPPLQISAQAPSADRSISRVQFWCGDVGSAKHELAMVRRIFEDAWIKLDVVQDSAVTRERFLDAYQDDTHDVLWIASHAEHDPYAPEEAALALRPGHAVTLRDLLECAPSSSDHRRLLVLNTCDSANSCSQGPFDEMGLGRALVHKNQAVVGHLWRTYDPWAAAFGALLAIGLVENGTFAEAFSYALTQLQTGKDKIFQLLQEKRVGVEAGEFWELLSDQTIFDWGSPAFLN